MSGADRGCIWVSRDQLRFNISTVSDLLFEIFPSELIPHAQQLQHTIDSRLIQLNSDLIARFLEFFCFFFFGRVALHTNLEIIYTNFQLLVDFTVIIGAVFLSLLSEFWFLGQNLSNLMLFKVNMISFSCQNVNLL